MSLLVWQRCPSAKRAPIVKWKIYVHVPFHLAWRRMPFRRLAVDNIYTSRTAGNKYSGNDFVCGSRPAVPYSYMYASPESRIIFRDMAGPDVEKYRENFARSPSITPWESEFYQGLLIGKLELQESNQNVGSHSFAYFHRLLYL